MNVNMADRNVFVTATKRKILEQQLEIAKKDEEIAGLERKIAVVSATRDKHVEHLLTYQAELKAETGEV